MSQVLPRPTPPQRYTPLARTVAGQGESAHQALGKRLGGGRAEFHAQALELPHGRQLRGIGSKPALGDLARIRGAEHVFGGGHNS